MKLSTTTLDFLEGGYWARTPAQAVELFRETGFRHLDFSFGYLADVPDSPFFAEGDGWKREIDEAMETAAKLGMDFVVAHDNSMPDDFAAGGEVRERCLTQLRNSIEACGRMGIRDMVIHGEFKWDDPEASDEERFEHNRVYYEAFSDALDKYNVNGLVENGGTAEFLLGSIRYAKNPRMHAVWDVGHANIEPEVLSQYDSIMALGEELRTVHIHDNFGKELVGKLTKTECDVHMLPYTGTANYDEVICALLDSGYQGYFNMEAVELLRRESSYAWNPRHVWERERRALNPSEKVRVLAEQLLYEIGKSMLEAYDCFEE